MNDTISYATSLDRWRAKSPAWSNEMLKSHKNNLENIHLSGVVLAVANVATYAFTNSLWLQVASCVIGLPIAAVLITSTIVVSKYCMDWRDYRHIETVKKISDFWCKDDSIEEFSKKFESVYAPQQRFHQSSNPIKNLVEYGLVSDKIATETFKSALEYIVNSKNMAKREEIKKEWPSLFEKFKNDFPNFESAELTPQEINFASESIRPIIFVENIYIKACSIIDMIYPSHLRHQQPN